MADDLRIRPIVESEYEAYNALESRQFHEGHPGNTDADREWKRNRFAGQRVTGAFDGDRIVGTFRSWDDPLPVPGGTLQSSYLSAVTVAPTHRRQGVLTRMMKSDLEQARAAGSPLAYLIASEAVIYGRFGFGVATEHVKWTVDADARNFQLPAAATSLTVELTEDATVRDAARAVYDAAYVGMPGAQHRDELTWSAILGTAGLSRPEKHPRYAVVVRDRENPVAYARYYVTEGSAQRVDTSVLTIRDLAATTDDAYARIWHFLASIDVVKTIRAFDRPVEEPLPWLLVDRRGARQSDRADFGWVRVLDVESALSGRRYSAPGAWTIEVIDPLAFTGGTFTLEVDASGVGSARPTGASPDLTLDVSTLGSAYLGQLPLDSLRRAGRVLEHTPGAVAGLTAALTFPASAFVTHTWF